MVSMRWPVVMVVAAIAILLPIAIVIGVTAGEDNETATPSLETTVQASPARGTGLDVNVPGLRFVPSEATIKTGETVNFRNTSTSDHRVRFDGDADRYDLVVGDTFTWKAGDPGEVDFICEIHPNDMTGTLTVVR